jgi:anaerobic magnesium-protoporphyrin IX monomethyl ester cyclase
MSTMPAGTSETAGAGGGARRVLLLAMPDVASSFDRVMRFPNLALTSLAANVDDAEVRVLDLVLAPRHVGHTVVQTLNEFQPHLVGLSAMTFQYHTARQLAALIRRTRPETRVVLGGYHATLAWEEIAADPEAGAIDFLVRGEGEAALNQLVQALRASGDLSAIPGLSYRTAAGFVHNPRAAVLDLGALRSPARQARLRNGFSYFGKPFDVVETSRGCTRACSFCCIRHMYGGCYRTYALPRVIEDIRAAAEAGAEGVFFVDDNINLDGARFRQLCEAIVEAGLDRLDYLCQADVAGFAQAPEVIPLMQRAGFRGVFLGIERVEQSAWRFLRKSNSLGRTQEIVRSLRAHGIAVAGGFIVGHPDDDAAAVKQVFRTARHLGLDHAIMWCLTPYPGTEVRAQLLAESLVVNPGDYRHYNGFICNVRTRRLTHRQLVRTIAAEGLKLYFHPEFLVRGGVWRQETRRVLPYLQASLEYLTRGYRNRLFASRHTL